VYRVDHPVPSYSQVCDGVVFDESRNTSRLRMGSNVTVVLLGVPVGTVAAAADAQFDPSQLQVCPNGAVVPSEAWRTSCPDVAGSTARVGYVPPGGHVEPEETACQSLPS
jgi:hypothetical protein